MAQLVKFPSIDQFRTVVKNVRDRWNHNGQPLPKLNFNGTVKLHGTNAGVVKDPRTGEIWCQSREQIITPEKDNAGFARFIDELGCFDRYFNVAAGVYGMNNIQPGDLIGIYGEWCGQGILKGCAIHQLSKRFVVFGIKVYTPGATTDDAVLTGTSRWFNPAQLLTAHEKFISEVDPEVAQKVFSIQQFPSWNIEIDFSNPELIQNYLVELTDAVEKQCPVGKKFGVEGIGEGIVWRCVSNFEYPRNSGSDVSMVKIKTSDLVFKVKGEKHSDTKVKVTASVDVEKVQNIKQFAENVVTDHRCEKMIEKLKEQGLTVDVKNTGAFLKLVGADVLKEESDVIDASGLERKDVMPAVNNVAKNWFLSLAKSSPL